MFTEQLKTMGNISHRCCTNLLRLYNMFGSSARQKKRVASVSSLVFFFSVVVHTLNLQEGFSG